MAGKAVLFLVMTSFVIFSRFGLRNADVVNRTFDKMADYNAQSNAYNIAVTGANVAFSRLNALLPSPPIITDASITNPNFGGGSFSITCAKVPGTSGNYTLTSTGTYSSGSKTYRAQVIITYQPGNWGRWAYYSENDGSLTWTGDNAIYGPFHTQSDFITVSHHPQFFGEASIKGTGNVVHYENDETTDLPNFAKGLATGIDRQMKSDSMDSTLIAGNSGRAWKITGKSVVYLTFDHQNVTYKFDSGSWNTSTISSKTANGVIYVVDGIVRVKGVVDGKVTVLATGTASSKTKGDIFIDDDITLADDPRTNPNSDDFLGLVASNYILIADNDNTKNIHIDAAIFSLYEGFGAENSSSRSIDGTIYLYGGIVQKERQGVGAHSGSTRTNGFEKDYRYDGRFEQKWPPFYPCGKAYRILSWYDGVGSCNKTY